MFFASDHTAGRDIMDHVLHRQLRMDEQITFPNLEIPYTFAANEEWFEDLNLDPDNLEG